MEATTDKPVVAILTIEDDTQLFRGNRANFADLIQTGQQMGILTYVVTVKHLKLQAPRILGYIFRESDEAWVQAWFPRPHVVYNRIPQREDERLPRVKKKLSALAKQPDIRLFNRRFFNKWSLGKVFSKQVLGFTDAQLNDPAFEMLPVPEIGITKDPTDFWFSRQHVCPSAVRR